jgi:hypothetical protein
MEEEGSPGPPERENCFLMTTLAGEEEKEEEDTGIFLME